MNHCDGGKHFEEWKADLETQQGAWAVFDAKRGAYINPGFLKLASKTHGINGCSEVIARLGNRVETYETKLNGQAVTITGMTDRCQGCLRGCQVRVAKISRRK